MWRDYEVVERQVIDARSARLAPGTDRAVLTLVTCYPFDAVVPGGPLRYLVFAEGFGQTGGSGSFRQGFAAAASIVLFILVLIFGMVANYIVARREKKYMA